MLLAIELCHYSGIRYLSVGSRQMWTGGSVSGPAVTLLGAVSMSVVWLAALLLLASRTYAAGLRRASRLRCTLCTPHLEN